MQLGKHVILWIMIIGIGFWSLPIFTTRADLEANLTNEINIIRNSLGDKSTDSAIERANQWYQLIMIDSGIQSFMDNRKSTPNNTAKALTGNLLVKLSELTNGYLENATINAYGLMIRGQLLVLWVPLIVVVGIGTLLDAIAIRLIRLHGFSYFSQTVVHVSQHLMLALTFLPVLYMIVPYAMSPMWIPFMCLAALMAIWAIIVSAHRVLG